MVEISMNVSIPVRLRYDAVEKSAATPSWFVIIRSVRWSSGLMFERNRTYMRIEDVQTDEMIDRCIRPNPRIWNGKVT
jgi:hypothetical protein